VTSYGYRDLTTYERGMTRKEKGTYGVVTFAAKYISCGTDRTREAKWEGDGPKRPSVTVLALGDSYTFLYITYPSRAGGCALVCVCLRLCVYIYISIHSV